VVGAGKLSPAPMSDPITACVPDIGIDANDDVKMNVKVEKLTENIAMLCYLASTLSRLLIIPLASLSVTAPEQNNAPKSAPMAPIAMRTLTGSDIVPYDVPRPFAPSLAPIENDIRKLSTNVRTSQVVCVSSISIKISLF